MLKTLLAVGSGASCGALLRWLLEMMGNSLFPSIPLGTLAANLFGGFLAGIAISVLAEFPSAAPELRLFVMTGFLGGLTTFSAFSVQVGALLQQQRLVTAAAAVALHVCGSLIMLFLGMGSYNLFKSVLR
ncbi:MAG: fluoride efflux transporter CrcB [Deltaproteobacteria bacterium]|jgi:CrcB protein|nr:fluoride efflux transporter CrcB [Deltaproteobacteria bacterium]